MTIVVVTVAVTVLVVARVIVMVVVIVVAVVVGRHSKPGLSNTVNNHIFGHPEVCPKSKRIFNWSKQTYFNVSVFCS